MSTMSDYLPPISESKACHSQQSDTERYVRMRDYRLTHLIPPTVLDFEKNLGPQLSRIVLAQMSPMERKLVGVVCPSSRATTCGTKIHHLHSTKDLPHETILSMGVKIEEKQRREYEHELKCRVDAAIAQALAQERAKCLQITETEVNNERKIQLELQKVWRRGVVRDYKEHLSQLEAKRRDTNRKLVAKLEDSISRTQQRCDPKARCELEIVKTVENLDAYAGVLKTTFASNLKELHQLQKMQSQQDEADYKLCHQHISMLTTSARSKLAEIHDKLTSLGDESEPECPEVLPVVAQMLQILQERRPASEILQELEGFVREFGCKGFEESDRMVDLTQTEILLDDTCITTFGNANDTESLNQESASEIKISEDASVLSGRILKILKDFKFDLLNPNLNSKIQDTIDNHYPNLTPMSSKVGSFLSAVDSLEVIDCPRTKVATPPVIPVTNLLATTDSLVIHHDHLWKSMDLSKTEIKTIVKREDFSWNRPKMPKYFKKSQPIIEDYDKIRVVKFKSEKVSPVFELHEPPDMSCQPRRSSLRCETISDTSKSQQDSCIRWHSEHVQHLKHVQFGGSNRSSSKLSL